VAGGKDEQQLTGLAWNTDKVKQVGEALKIGVPNEVNGAAIWKRHPHAVKFSLGEGKTDLVMIAVHMKANTGGSPPPRKKRELEAKTLMQQLGNVESHFKDLDVIVCGDINVLNKFEKAVNLFTAFGFKDLNNIDESTHLGGAPFDRFFVPGDQPEFTGFEQQVFDEEYLTSRTITRTTFRKDFSDHFMVVTKVRILADDDQ
jgi:hypothetical protein